MTDRPTIPITHELHLETEEVLPIQGVEPSHAKGGEGVARPLTWVRLGDKLPEIAQPILLARWDAEGFWRVRDAMLLIKHEGVQPKVADMDKGLPTDWWFDAIYGRDTRLATPNLLWTPMPLPDPPAEA